MQRIVRQSEIKKFLRCRRQWWLTYEEGYHLHSDYPSKSGADLGTLFHAAAEAYEEGKNPNKAILKKLKEILEERNISPAPEEWAKEVEFAKIMFEGYEEWVEANGIGIGEEVVATEQKLTMDFEILGETVTISGTVDLLSDDGDLIPTDYKTGKTLEAPHMTDFQLRTYALLVWHNYDRRPKRARYRRARSVKRTNQAKPPFYGDYEIRFSEGELRTHKNHLERILTEMMSVRDDALDAPARDSLEHPALYPNTTRDCRWDCPFRDMCPMVDNGADFRIVLEEEYERA